MLSCDLDSEVSVLNPEGVVRGWVGPSQTPPRARADRAGQGRPAEVMRTDSHCASVVEDGLCQGPGISSLWAGHSEVPKCEKDTSTPHP